MLRTLPIPRKSIDSKRLYDRLDLDVFADRLDDDEPANSCDVMFGINAAGS